MTIIGLKSIKMDSDQVIEVCQADYNNDNPISIDGIARLSLIHI